MAGLNAIAPRNDIPEYKKDADWMKTWLDYAEGVLKSYNQVRTRMTRLMNGYNGVKDPLAITWLTKRYGTLDKSPFISYRLGRTQIDLLHGEWIKRPLVSTVETVNSQSVSEKNRQRDFVMGAMLAKDESAKIKQMTGVDITKGIQVPEDETAFQKMEFKDQCEDIMQIIINQQTKKLDAKQKLGECFRNLELTNYTAAKVELDEKGRVKLWPLDPRDCIFEAIQGDDYAEQSPIRGCRIAMPVHMILMRYELTKEQRDKLNDARTNWKRYIGADGLSRGYMSYVGGELLCDVIHIEWDSVTKMYEKVVPKTPNQLMVDPSEKTLRFQIDTDKYEANPEYYNGKAVKEGWEIVTRYMDEQYEATRIGGIIDINMRKKPKKRSIDDPSTILSSSYIFYVHGRVNGTTISLQQMMENYDNLYDIVRYMLNRELAKSKGKILTIDRAALGAKEKIMDMLHKMVNDQVLEYDSSAAGNISGRQLDPQMLFKQFDLGLSDSFPYLIQFKQDLVNEINLITGISDNRMGQTAASSTATAQQSDIANSRTITEALFYGFSGFTKRVLQQIVNYSALSYAYYRTEEGEQVLGSDRFAFLNQNLEELVYRDYAVHIEDGSLYAELSQKIEALMEVSLNAKEIRTMDAMNVMLAETLAQKRQFLIDGWNEVNRIAQETQERELQAQNQMAQQQMQTQLQIAQENREDLQLNEKENIQLKTQGQIQIDNNKAENEMHIKNMEQSHEINMLGADNVEIQ